jgi:hypothetical protein
MSTINETYINALLADASYLTLSDVQKQVLPEDQVNAAIAASLTQTQAQADFITANFEVLTQELSATGGFDAVVWRDKPNFEVAGLGNVNAGKVYVSMRGTQGGTDIADDGDLALNRVPSRQIESMVNWWLRRTTSPSQQAVQIQALTHVVPAYPTPIVVADGFSLAPRVPGTDTAPTPAGKCSQIHSCLRIPRKRCSPIS